jgi:hypothetical protein
MATDTSSNTVISIRRIKARLANEFCTCVELASNTISKIESRIQELANKIAGNIKLVQQANESMQNTVSNANGNQPRKLFAG